MLHRGTKTAETEIFSAIAVGYKAGESTFEYYRHFPQFARFGKRNFPACGFAVGLRFQRAGSREMCGRFVRARAPELYGQLFGVDSVPDIPSFNIAPTQMIAVIRMQEDYKVCVSLRWGMIPFWAKDKKTSYINARGDTVASKPAFRAAFKKRRCLILADGYYEWKAEGKKKQPYYYSMKDDQPIALAGIWDSWTNKDESDAQPIESCAIITTDANELAHVIHDRMPVILRGADATAWIDPEITDAFALQPLLRPFPADQMLCRAVGSYVNSVKNHGSACIEPP